MRRDIGNEIIVAIAAIGMLAIAIVFAIILSLSRNAENAPTPTIPSSTSIAVNTAVETLVPSAPQNADTPTPTEPTATSTDIPATSTPEPQATSTPIPTTEQASTAQHVTKPSLTATKVEATDTITVPSASPTKQATLEPTVPTDTPTKTVVPSSETPQASATSKPSATRTPSPIPPTLTFTATIRPSATDTAPPSATFTASPVPASKTPRPTFTSIPASPTPQPPLPIPTSEDGLAAEGCTDSGVQISNLLPGQQVKGVVTLIGTAYNPNLLYYKIETRPDFSRFYTLYNRYEMVVIQNELGTIDTGIFSPGLYWIKLTVVNKDNTLEEPCAIPVIFQR